MNELERVLEEWAKAWAAHDIDKLLTLFADDCHYEDVALGMVSRGKQELRSFAEQTLAAVPDFALELRSRFVCGDRGAMEWEMSGTHKADVPGIPSTGKRFSAIRAVTIVEFRGNKIHRNVDYWDAATVMRQTGVLPAGAVGKS